MSFSSGVYSLPGPALNTGDTVSATENNTFRNDVATAFNLTWLRNGTAAATADIPMGGFSLTGTAAVGSAGSLLLKTNGGTTAVTLDAAQNMGLGVTPSAWGGAITRALQVGTTVNLANGYNSTYLSNNAYNNSSNNWIYQTTGNTVGIYSVQAGSTPHVWYTAPSGTAGGTVSLTQAMTLDASGNLGIGTSSPSTYATGIAVQNATAALALTTGTYTSKVDILGNTMYLRADTGGTSGDMRFYVNGNTERARIDTSGNLLVGRTSALGYSEKLSVGGTIALSGSQINMVSGGDFEFVQRSAAKQNFYVNSGSVMATLSITGVWTNASDARYKENIVDSTYGLDTVMALKPRTYNLIDQADKPQVGFIAQEVLEVVPEVVESVYNSVTEEDRYTLSYGQLTAVLTKAIQEQQAIIQQLQADVAALKA